ncbi:MAG: hypothetical protein ABFE02_14475 [Sulfuricella sp.]
MTLFQFSLGARVRLTAFAARYYGGNLQWTPPSQGGGTTGTVIAAEDRSHDYRADARPYLVRWDNGAQNSYREADLVEALDESVSGSNNVITFGSISKGARND